MLSWHIPFHTHSTTTTALMQMPLLLKRWEVVVVELFYGVPLSQFLNWSAPKLIMLCLLSNVIWRQNMNMESVKIEKFICFTQSVSLCLSLESCFELLEQLMNFNVTMCFHWNWILFWIAFCCGLKWFQCNLNTLKSTLFFLCPHPYFDHLQFIWYFLLVIPSHQGCCFLIHCFCFNFS